MERFGQPHGDTAIGLFQGMFELNILTFNPGWDGNAQPVESFTDVRDLQRALKQRGWNSHRRPTRGQPPGRSGVLNPRDSMSDTGGNGEGIEHDDHSCGANGNAASQRSITGPAMAALRTDMWSSPASTSTVRSTPAALRAAASTAV